MSKAVKLYSRTNEYQLAKRSDGIWFLRLWKNNGYGPNWTKWEEIGKIVKIEKMKFATKCEYCDSYDDEVSKVVATFNNKLSIRIVADHKRFENNLRLPNERN